LLQRAALFVVLLVAVLFTSRRAEAYPWMVRHGYVQCAECHADPAGGGLLNPYGRAQGEILMRMRYGSPADSEPGPLADPVWGLLPELPQSLLVGGDVRWARVIQKAEGGDATGRFILMQSDLAGQLKLGRFRANGSIGYVSEGGSAAALTRAVDSKFVSRVYWVGVDLGKNEDVLLRAGRMNVPFGIRSIEHTMFTRTAMRTDINTGQQHGIAVDYHRGPWRASLMGIAGNFQIRQDDFRSRGYAGLVEYAIQPTLAVGVSSMVVHQQLDFTLLTPTFRQAHGVFARYSPHRSTVVSAEWDFLHASQETYGKAFFGGVGMASADFEPIQGLHVGPTFELLTRDSDQKVSYGVWGTAWWFLFSHVDMRFDAIAQQLSGPAAATNVLTFVLQVHAYL
jgi:hypothetical protein